MGLFGHFYKEISVSKNMLTNYRKRLSLDTELIKVQTFITELELWEVQCP